MRTVGGVRGVSRPSGPLSWPAARGGQCPAPPCSMWQLLFGSRTVFKARLRPFWGCLPCPLPSPQLFTLPALAPPSPLPLV